MVLLSKNYLSVVLVNVIKLHLSYKVNIKIKVPYSLYYKLVDLI